MLKVMMMMMMLWQLVSLVLADHSFSLVDDEKTPAGKYLVMTNNNFFYSGEIIMFAFDAFAVDWINKVFLKSFTCFREFNYGKFTFLTRILLRLMMYL